ncbi:MAG: hypothetical protein K9G29_10060, partial [Crocinitomicaceae bacterium]|nr:hypothetical protein [Crocinitomicaceae bacterium]
NTLLESLETKLNGIGNCGAKIEYIKSVIDVAPGTFNSLVGNYAISKTIEAMITEMDQPSKMIKGISSLLAEAVFGRSKFPIWIVYTVNDDGELPPAKLLPNKSDFIKNKIQDFETNLNENIPLFYFRARENAASNNKQYVGSYILNFYTLSNITKTDSDIEFFMTEYRCDSGDKIIIKATREMSLLDFETNLNI